MFGIFIIMILVIFENLWSHGSVATQLKCGKIFNNYVIANCAQNVTVKKKSKIS